MGDIRKLKFHNQGFRFVGVFALCAVVFFACIAYAYFIEPNRLIVIHSTLKIKNWNPAFDGFRVAMIGDIHAGSNNVSEEKLREIVARTNEQGVDLVVLLGDYISETNQIKPETDNSLKMPLGLIADNLAGLKAKYGVYAVLGNHDGYYGDERVAGELARVGYKVLQNEVAAIEKDGQRIRIFGMKDQLKLTGGWVQTSIDSKKMLSGTGTGDVIVLEHSPDILNVISGEFLISPDLRLILAAHTHGGQVRFPILGPPVVPSGYGQKYVSGHVYENNVDMFITSGIGTSVLPIRFMVPPEIAVLTIRSEN